jgi:NAD-dependent dihydropyrimidine dehydrogenase PreA subunit
MPYVVTEPCISVEEHACVDACPVECFYQAEDQLLIHPDECIDCGACVSECPVNAIFEVGSVPDKWKSYIDKNTTPFRANAGLPKAIPQNKWEAQRHMTGSLAYRYYEKYGKSPRVAPDGRESVV